MTQQLADRRWKKREYAALIEKGETDMQLSTFIMMSEAPGLGTDIFRKYDRPEHILYSCCKQKSRVHRKW